MKRFAALASISIISLGLITGCTNDTDRPADTETTQPSDSVVEDTDGNERDDRVERDDMDMMDNGKIKEEEIREEQSYKNDKSEKSDVKMMNLSVYVASDDAMTLKREVRNLEVEDMRVGWAVLNALKETPIEPNHFAPVPKSITFNSLIIKDGLATVDYDDSGFAMGSAGESIFVESVILSLTRFPTVDRVKFTRNGEENPVTGNMVLDGEYDRSDVNYATIED
jgi:spore germination protein GerM